MVFFFIKFPFLAVIRKLEDNVQDPFHSPVQNCFVQFSLFYRFCDLFICMTAASRHFQFQSCL